MSEKTETYVGTGRRKTAVARVRVTSGEGKFIVNKRDVREYFTQIASVEQVLAPLEAVGAEKSVDIKVRVAGGGQRGQAGAVQLGIARALLKANEEHEEVLRERKFLTRDARKTERKKYGRAGARRSFQFSKR